jgi:HSP20 family protein
MQLVRRSSPFSELDRYQRELDRLFEPFERVFAPQSNGREALSEARWVPAVDVEENEQAFVISVDAPQVKKEDVHITIRENVLVVSGERKEERSHKDARVHRTEARYGSFARSFTLPDNVEESGISAAFTDGVLRITLPKSEKPKETRREIPIA